MKCGQTWGEQARAEFPVYCYGNFSSEALED
jgi:hypothetical protein